MARSCVPCCATVFRVLLVIFNIMGMLLGLTFVLLGVAFIWTFSIAATFFKEQIAELTESLTSSLKSSLGMDVDVGVLLTDFSTYTTPLGVAFLLTGLLIFIVACLGACGACCKMEPCLVVFAVATLLILIGQMTVVGIWFGDGELIKGAMDTVMRGNLKKFVGINGTNLESLVTNALQIFVGCCGVTNGSDFPSASPNWDREYTYTDSGTGFSVKFNLSYPVSCCKFNLTTFELVDKNCVMGVTTTANSNHYKGCYLEFYAFIDKYIKLDYFFYSIIGLMMYQLLVLVGALVVLSGGSRSPGTVHPSKRAGRVYGKNGMYGNDGVGRKT